MATLRLGVVDVPYTDDPSPSKTDREVKNQKRNDIRAALGLQEFHGTTGDVAEILEEHYHVMEIFFEEHQSDIAGVLEETYGDALEDMLSGGVPAGSNSMIAAAGQIKDLFTKFIDGREMDGVQPGVPTGAAKKGVNYCLKHPTAKGNPERPSFKDTGLYEQSFQAEIVE
jgi:hypothetical protein